MDHDVLKNKIVLVVNTYSSKRKFVLQRLKKMGLKIICLNKEKNWANDYVDAWILADTFNHTESIAAVKNFLKLHPEMKPDGVITYLEDDVLLTSKICDTFGYVGIPLAVANKARNKYLFREFCAQHNLPTPKHQIIEAKKDLDKALKYLKFPLVIKPVYGSSSAFVVKVKDKQDLLETYQYIRQTISPLTESALTEGMNLLLEEYIDGDEVDIDILLQNGKVKFYSIADNYRTTEPFFVETLRALPSSLPADDQDQLIRVAEEVLERLGVLNGCIHFEAKMTKHGPVPLEANLRLGGDEVYESTKGVWGVDLVENLAKIACGVHIKPEKSAEPKKYILSQTLHADQSGVVANVNIDEKLKRQRYVEEFYFGKQVGDPILVPPDGYEYLGWLSVSGDNLLDAQDNLKEALSFINYQVAEFDEESFLGKTLRKNKFSAAVFNKNLLIQAAKIEKVKKVSLRDQRSLHIALVGNFYSNIENLENSDFSSPVRNIRENLVRCGYEVSFFNASNLSEALRDIQKNDIDVIFNACEEWVGDPGPTRSQITAALESLHLPITGSEALNLGICQNKILMKKILHFHNIPTPDWDYAYELSDSIKEDLRYPLIVKPGIGDNSFGITNDSVVRDKKELERQVKKVITQLKKPALVEEYIAGEEYEVSVLGNSREDFRVLPLARSVFKKTTKGEWPICSYEAKWLSGSKKPGVQVETPVRKINKKLESLLTEIALDTYTVLHCQDYGRVEIRVDEDDNPYVLELDPNPSLVEGSGFIKSAQLIDLSYSDLLEDIIRMTINRFKS